MTKFLLRERAVSLRRAGFSYRYIQKKLLVSLGTLAEWLHDVPYTPNKETVKRIGKARVAAMLTKLKQSKDRVREAEIGAKKDVGKLTERDVFMLGIGLYIGEGSKTHNNVRVINADPQVIKFAIKWFKRTCGLTDNNFRIRLHIYPDSDPAVCLNFWSKELKMSSALFQKAQIDTRKDKKHKKAGKLPYGTAHLSVLSIGNKEHGVFLARRIGGWIKEVLK